MSKAREHCVFTLVIRYLKRFIK